MPAKRHLRGHRDGERTFTFTATDDTTDDDGESVKFTFGSTLPTGVSEGSTNEATVAITDDDAPASVTVNFAQACSYTVAEGSSVAGHRWSPWTTTRSARW